MSIKTTQKLLTKDLGETNELSCPVCKNTVNLRFFENIDFSAAAVLLGKDSSAYFAVCPQCASVFGINENYIQAYTSKTTCYMTESDLSVIRKGKADEQ